MKTMLETMEILLEVMPQDILAGKIRYETYVKAENVKARYLKTDKGYLNKVNTQMKLSKNKR